MCLMQDNLVQNIILRPGFEFEVIHFLFSFLFFTNTEDHSLLHYLQ